MSVNGQRAYRERHPDRIAASVQRENARRKELRSLQPVRQESKSYYPHITRGITMAERTEWARHRVYEAADRALAHPTDPAYEVAYQSRLRELQALERVSA